MAQVAKQFGGGGHRNAAGFKIKGNPDIEEVRTNLFAVLQPLVGS
jgi:nanoRNase/pAp phosphatase (c-di-AMP/oligoRNAs hydrolase)